MQQFVFVGVWTHGDFCVINGDTGGIVMLGRRFIKILFNFSFKSLKGYLCKYLLKLREIFSDGVLNPNGVRFGSAEIYNVITRKKLPFIKDTLCVGQETCHGERVVLFIKMEEGKRFEEKFHLIVKFICKLSLHNVLKNLYLI